MRTTVFQGLERLARSTTKYMRQDQSKYTRSGRNCKLLTSAHTILLRDFGLIWCVPCCAFCLSLPFVPPHVHLHSDAAVGIADLVAVWSLNAVFLSHVLVTHVIVVLVLLKGVSTLLRCGDRHVCSVDCGSKYIWHGVDAQGRRWVSNTHVLRRVSGTFSEPRLDDVE